MLILLQRSHCTFVTILFRPFARLFFNLAMRIRALFSKSASNLRLAEQAFWRMPFFTEWVGASSFKVILAGLSRHSSTGTLASGTSGSRWFSLILPRGRTRRRIMLCRFCTLIDIVTETAIVFFRTLPVGLPLPTISQDFFVHAVLPSDSWTRRSFHNFLFWLKNSWFVDSARYFYHCFQSVIFRSSFLLMNLHIVQFQYGLEFLRLSYS